MKRQSYAMSKVLSLELYPSLMLYVCSKVQILENFSSSLIVSVYKSRLFLCKVTLGVSIKANKTTDEQKQQHIRIGNRCQGNNWSV